MSDIQLPAVLFKTKKPFEDYSSDDMRYGDLSETVLKKEFGLWSNATHALDLSHFLQIWKLRFL